MQIEWNRVTWYSKLGAVVVLVLTILLAFYFWSEYQEIQALKNSLLVDISQPQSGNNHQSTIDMTDDTSNWQTYRNEEFGFEVKYPKDYAAFGSYKDTISIGEKNLVEPSLAPIGIDVSFGKWNWQTVDELAQIDYPEQSATRDLRVEKRLTTLNGERVLEIKDYDDDIFLIIIRRDNKLSHLRIYNFSELSKEEFKKSKAILSTFRFVNEVESSTIRDFDFKAYFTAMPQYQECREYSTIYGAIIHLGPIEYYDFTGDGREEAVVAGKSCFGGTGGDDIFGAFAASDDGSVVRLPMNQEGFIGNGLRGKAVWEIRNSKLVEILPVYLGHEPNCCAEGGTREITYEWNGQEFVITKVENIPPS